MSKMLKYCFALLFILNGLLNTALAETSIDKVQVNSEQSTTLFKKASEPVSFAKNSNYSEEERLFLEEKYEEEEDDKAKTTVFTHSFFIRTNLKNHWLASLENEDILAGLSTSLERESLYNRNIYLLIAVFRI